MSLPDLQAWFLTVMTSPGGVEQGQALALQRHGWRLDDVIAHGHGAAPAARMRIYADGYVLRLLDCLRADYPLVHKLLGEDLFSFFARGYIWRHPPSTTSLYDLGAGFAGFLAASQAGQGADGALRLPVALAQLERACTEAGRAPGLEAAGRAAGQAVSPLDWLMGGDPLLRTPACLRLLDLDVPALDYARALLAADDVPPAPARARSLLTVTRMAFRVGMKELQEWQYHFLARLVAAGPEGMLASQCLPLAARHADLSEHDMRVNLLAWLPGALAAGLIHSLPTGNESDKGRAAGGCDPFAAASQD
ncbi:putative DNA-binding domain-containing protein [Pseudoduganella sp. R-32]|uniref:HvfC/BufC family peptide modification chaperone n=1 Tax=Pseudoduganella sp. R-32 TaxID=3404061 RepID=UPI003CF7ECCC